MHDQTKKALVAFDPAHPDKQSSDFLVPVFDDFGEAKLLSTRSKRSHRYGMVVLTNRPLSAHDLFAKLVDAGVVIPNVEDALSMLSRFVSEIEHVRIGNIVEVAQVEHAFELVVAAKSPSGFRKGTT